MPRWELIKSTFKRQRTHHQVSTVSLKLHSLSCFLYLLLETRGRAEHTSSPSKDAIQKQEPPFTKQKIIYVCTQTWTKPREPPHLKGDFYCFVQKSLRRGTAQHMQWITYNITHENSSTSAWLHTRGKSNLLSNSLSYITGFAIQLTEISPASLWVGITDTPDITASCKRKSRLTQPCRQLFNTQSL